MAQRREKGENGDKNNLTVRIRTVTSDVANQNLSTKYK